MSQEQEIVCVKDLKSVAQKILGERYYDDLWNFLQPFLIEGKDEGTESQAINKLTLFVTRRLSCLADIYIRINGCTLPKNRRYLTNSALINAANWVAKQIADKNEPVPTIEVVDDSISYGRAIVNILDVFKLKLIDYLKAHGVQNAEAEAEAYIRDRVSVHIYMRKMHGTLLPQEYRSNLSAVRKEEDYVWNDFSNRVSELISNADVANAAFVLSAGLNAIPESCGGWTRIETEYHKKKEWVFFKKIGKKENGSIAIAAIRCFRCSGSDMPYRIVPFIFLPELDREKLDWIENKSIFLDNVALKPIICLNKDMYRQTNTLRSRQEFVTMYLSQSLLLDFCEKSGISQCNNAGMYDLEQYDTQKVEWNYDDLLPIGENRRTLLKPEHLNNRELWLSADEIEAIFAERFTELAIPEEVFGKQTSDLTPEDINRFVELYENYVFECGVQAEQEAKELIEKPYRPTVWQCAAKDPDRRRSFKVVLEEMLKLLNAAKNPEWKRNFTEMLNEMSEYIEQKYFDIDLFHFLGYTLQMMDAGLISVVERVKEEFSERDSVKMEQQVRTCEQALAILPKRCYDSIDVAGAVNEEFDWTRSGISDDYISVLRNRIAPTLERYVAAVQNIIRYPEMYVLIHDENDTKVEQRKYCDDLCRMLRGLKKASQSVENWSVGMSRHYIVNDSGQIEGVNHDGGKLRCELYCIYLQNRKEFLSRR